jgi:hypothetical protein
MRITRALLILAAFARPALAQSEEDLRAFFEGKTVVVKIEMPGTEAGVDVRPGAPQAVLFPIVARRLKLFGTALRPGDQVLVTKVKVKKDLIEFQLGGGGYGTFGDDVSPNVNVPATPKSARERELEDDLKRTDDPDERRRLRDRLDRLRQDRQREDARNQARTAEAREIKAANIRQRRAEAGSRFNFRYSPVVPPEALTPESVMQVLADYVDFSPVAPGASVALGAPGAPGAPLEPNADVPDQPNELRRGLTVEQVDGMLGRPDAITKRREGTLIVSTSTYRTPGRIVTAEFVEGVLIRFAIAPDSP